MMTERTSVEVVVTARRGGSRVAASTVEEHAASIDVVEDHLLGVSQAAGAGEEHITSSARSVPGNVVELSSS